MSGPPEGAPGPPPHAGIPLFAGSWPHEETARIGHAAETARKLAIEHARAGTAPYAGPEAFPNDSASYAAYVMHGPGSTRLTRALSLSGEDDPAFPVAVGTYCDIYDAATGDRPAGDWDAACLNGHQVVAQGGRPGALTGPISADGRVWARLHGDPGLTALPAWFITSPVVYVTADATSARGFAAATATPVKDGDVLYVPSQRLAAVMYRAWPFEASDPAAGSGKFFTWQGGPDALAAADGGRYAPSVTIARHLTQPPGPAACSPLQGGLALSGGPAAAGFPASGMPDRPGQPRHRSRSRPPEGTRAAGPPSP